MKSAIKKLLICPHCRGAININTNEIVCLKCHHSFPFAHGIIDLRTGVTQKGEWDLNVFEKGYDKMGYYKDEYGWAESGRYPHYVADYRYSRVKGKIIDWLRPQDDDIILDVGCGVGYFIFDIMKRYPDVNLSFAGLDPVRSNIYWLNYRSQEENKTNLIGIMGGAESLPFMDDSFDMIVTSEVIEHILDKEKAINQMHRVLKPGGRLFISTPARLAVEFWNNFFWLPQKIKRIFKPRKVSSTEKAPYDEPLTQRQLKRYLQQAGFTIEQFQQNVLMPHESYFQFFPYWLSWSIIKTAYFIENHLKPLFSWAGLHYVVKARK
ncbi:MAG: methyltransferase domain-containing protein [Planctomycetota bacterium]